MSDFPGISSEPFGALAPPAALGWILGTQNFDEPHPVQGFRRKIAKRFLRWTNTQLDVRYRGLKLRLLPYDNAGDLEIAMYGRHGEEDELDVFASEATGKNCLVDIGANIGIYSLSAAQVMQEEACILSFEPAPGTRARFEQNITLNNYSDRIEVVAAGVGPEPATLTLSRDKSHNAGSASLLPNQKGDDGIKVPVVRLIDELKKRSIEQIDILKIDIEGFEDRALMPFFQEAPEKMWPSYVMLETCHARLWSDDLIAALTKRGYEVCFENGRNKHFRAAVQ